jgi:hypothetical protein
MVSSIIMPMEDYWKIVSMNLEGITWAIPKKPEFQPIFSNVRNASSPW